MVKRQSLCMKNFSNNGLGNRPEAGELGDGRTGAVRVEPDLMVDRPGRDAVVVGT